MLWPEEEKSWRNMRESEREREERERNINKN